MFSSWPTSAFVVGVKSGVWNFWKRFRPSGTFKPQKVLEQSRTYAIVRNLGSW